MKIKEIVKEFEAKAIKTIEKVVDEAIKTMTGGRYERIKALFYLSHTGRFRENKIYKDSSFDRYILDRHLITVGTYENEKWAFLRFPDESQKRGPGIISSIKNKCGAGKVKKVLGEIKTAEGNRKTAIPRTKIQEIIDKNAKPVVEKPKKRPIKAFERELDGARATILEQGQTIKEQHDQIEKLKKAVNEYKEYKRLYEDLLLIVGPIAEVLKKAA